MWIFDATPLIYLAKVDRLELVAQLAGKCLIPEPVYEEVVETGIEQGYPDARRIERQIEAGVFDVVPVEPTPLYSRLQTNTSLSDADVAVLACADSIDGIAVMDETYGRDVAAAEGNQTRGTAYLVLTAAKEGTIGVDEAREIIDAMIENGWYCDPATYTKIVRAIESLDD